MSTPSSGRRGRSSEKAAKSNKKVVAVVKPQRFCSKFVQPVIEDLCRSILGESAKNLAAKDWTRKLSKSILKKVSEASREVFFSEEHKADKLQYKIDQLELTIEKQFNRLRENPNDRARIALQPSVPTEKAYISRQYSSQIQSIQDKVQRLSDEISFSRVAVASRLDSLEHNVDIVRGNVNHLVERAQLINHQATTIVSPTPAGSTQETEQLDIIENKSVQPIAKDNTTTTVPSKRKRSQGIEEIKQDPLHKMVEHLG